MSAWQGARTALAASLLAAGLVAVAPPAGACACGGIVDGPADESSVTAETAVLQWDGTTQTLVLELETLSTAPEVGLILPTPTPAEVALADPEIFRELDAITAPRAVVSGYRWWPDLGFGSTSAASAGGGAPGVDVLTEVRLGPLDVATLAATDTAALDAWLAERGFELPASVRGAIAPYVAEGWSFVAARLAPEEATTFDGTLQPLRVTFATDALVHPMRMSAAAEQTQRTRTYVLADHRMDRADPTADLAAPSVRFAGRVPPGSVGSAELAALLAAGDYVTAHEQTFTDPATQVVSDFAFVTAPSDATRSPTYAVVADKRIGPFFAGPVLAFGGVLVLSVLLVWGSRRHHAPVRAVAPRPARA
ncbi:hypothetical protein BJF88_08495 [Cellulosimicrobium sp. CUA-896]|nr:hypothetical protein BJF88_08495 [Cellulosimicrobium sp. CUA-896]